MELFRSIAFALEPKTAVRARALELVQEAERLKGSAGGTYLRWQYVAARLQKEFPDARLRDLHMAIEQAIQEM